MNLNSKSYNLVKKTIKVCLKQNIPFASYRLPQSNEIITLIQHSSFPEKVNTFNDLYRKKGFIVSPFAESDKNGVFFLNPDILINSSDISDDLIQNLENNKHFVELKKKKNNLQTTSYAEFTNNVNKAILAMEAKLFHKVVLSKVRVEKIPDTFEVEDFFLKLCRKYPHAFIYLMQLPELGCWVGATPEPLLTIENDVAQTASIAGTQLALLEDINAYSWSSKEIEEQKIVTKYVESILHAFDIGEISKKGPENYKAANLIHLKTTFEFSQLYLLERFGDFLKTLHPTPSVGGLPKKEAQDFILTNEKHNRSYYTGYFGPINIFNRTAIFVNLRCLQLFDKEYVLYSGAGITPASIAQKEWEETDNKMLTMVNAIKNLNKEND